MALVHLAKSVLPAEVAKTLLTRGEVTFASQYQETLLLLVNVAAKSDLLAALAAHVPGAEGQAFMPQRQLDYQTAAHDPDTIRALIATTSRRAQSDKLAVSSALEAGLQFVVPLRKRLDADQISTERISVGRTLNKDIVLRDSSVSKFHAWFALHEGCEFTVSDAGSLNLTRVNGEPIPPRRAWPIAPGDTIQFGSVQTLLCRPESLWKAIHEPTS